MYICIVVCVCVCVRVLIALLGEFLRQAFALHLKHVNTYEALCYFAFGYLMVPAYSQSCELHHSKGVECSKNILRITTSVPNNSTRLYPKTVPPYPTIVPNRTPKPYNRTTPYHKTLPLYHTVSQSRTSKLYKLVFFRRVGTVRVYPKTVPRKPYPKTVPQNRTPKTVRF